MDWTYFTTVATSVAAIILAILSLDSMMKKGLLSSNRHKRTETRESELERVPNQRKSAERR